MGELYKRTGITKRSIQYYSYLSLLKAEKNDNGQLVLLKSNIETLYSFFQRS
ncbi:hypothetical protein [Lysinibacillus sphaericus]|uniref:hypothetical protein n=1 Tax=Lysinibacillus sphaericus TaxID=1421 RepID=UPI0012D32376